MDEAEFDRFADEYHHHHAANIKASGEAPEFFAKYKVDDVSAVLRRSGGRPARILDFGGGVGNSLGPMRAAFPGSEIILLDPSSRSLEIARRRHPAGATFQQFDGRRIPLPDKAVDLVFASCVFHHIPADLHVPLLREIDRVLAPGGNLFVFEHNPYNPITVRAVRDCPFDDCAVLISAATMRQRLDDAGLTANRVVYRIFFPHFLRGLRATERCLAHLPLGAQYYAHAIKAAA
ncbi:MAG TPA: class I SAM-dependent methyltransferase [Dongiaceae bacterium]|jgi:SAM-dependent methyltransferase|nr:class I SAM-dependent methyltransferase [Dongiaceae bacterium]